MCFCRTSATFPRPSNQRWDQNPRRRNVRKTPFPTSIPLQILNAEIKTYLGTTGEILERNGYIRIFHADALAWTSDLGITTTGELVVTLRGVDCVWREQFLTALHHAGLDHERRFTTDEYHQILWGATPKT